MHLNETGTRTITLLMFFVVNACAIAKDGIAGARLQDAPNSVTLPAWHGTLKYVGPPRDDLFAFVRTDSQCRSMLDLLVKTARRRANEPIVRRVYKLDEIPESECDGRYRRESFFFRVPTLSISMQPTWARKAWCFRNSIGLNRK